MNNPLVSIVTPYFNSEKYFENTFKSVISQTYENWEWIIVDDGSNELSSHFLDEICKGNPKITIIHNVKNHGASFARNQGLKNASGRYVTFLDSDDILDPEYLYDQVSFIKNNGPLITSSYRRKTDNSCTDFIVPKQTTYRDALKGNPLSCLTTMYDRSVIGDILFDESFSRHEDYIFWLIILKQGIVAKGNQKVLATYILHEGSKNRKKSKLVKQLYDVYRKSEHFNWLKSWLYVIRYIFYSRKKYKNVR